MHFIVAHHQSTCPLLGVVRRAVCLASGSSSFIRGCGPSCGSLFLNLTIGLTPTTDEDRKVWSGGEGEKEKRPEIRCTKAVYGTMYYYILPRSTES